MMKIYSKTWIYGSKNIFTSRLLAGEIRVIDQIKSKHHIGHPNTQLAFGGVFNRRCFGGRQGGLSSTKYMQYIQ